LDFGRVLEALGAFVLAQVDVVLLSTPIHQPVDTAGDRVLADEEGSPAVEINLEKPLPI